MNWSYNEKLETTDPFLRINTSTSKRILSLNENVEIPITAVDEVWSNSKASDIALEIATMNSNELTDFFEEVMSIATGNQSKLIVKVVTKAEKDGRFLHK